MKSSQFFTGAIRGRGYARLVYDSRYHKEEQHATDISTKAIQTGLFGPEMIQNAVRLAGLKNSFRFWVTLLLLHSSAEGGTCIDESYAKETFRSMKEKIEPFDLTQDELIAMDSGYYYFKTYLAYELVVAKKIAVLLSSVPAHREWKFSESVNQDRKEELKNLLSHSLSFITGGPGSGKTTTIKQILETVLASGLDPKRIVLCAPTGKAAKRVSESCADILKLHPDLAEPLTIHRLLGYNPATGRIRHTESEPLPFHLIIVDEASMIDLHLMYLLLQSIPLYKDTRLILSGDKDQLLSVKAGSIFSDLIALEKNILVLNQSWRQSGEGEIISLFAKGLGKGDADLRPFLKKDLQIEKDCAGIIFFEISKEEELIHLIQGWYSIYGRRGQILTPYNTTPYGVFALNRQIQEKLFADNGFHHGEPVIADRNMYDIEIFNGETGFLQEEEGVWYFCSGNDKKKIGHNHFKHLKHSYVITIHKSQGSEYEHVCLVLPTGKEELLTRRILYTGITRAKKSVTIIGQAVIWNNILSESGGKRQSNLTERIKEGLV